MEIFDRNSLAFSKKDTLRKRLRVFLSLQKMIIYRRNPLSKKKWKKLLRVRKNIYLVPLKKTYEIKTLKTNTPFSY